MSRVAKALRKAGVALEETAAGGWGSSERLRADETVQEATPWKLHEVATAGEGDVRVDQAPASHAAVDGLGPHIAPLVRRLFLPPPVGAGLRSVLFCSTDVGSERTRMAIACAHVLAGQTQKRVCLLNTQADETGVPDTREEVRSTALGPPRRMSNNLWIAASAEMVRTMPAEMIARHVRELCERFDHLVVDAPALSGGAEISMVAALVQGVILVVDEERTRRDSAGHAAATLHAAGARLLGVVLANRRFPIPAALYERL